jgi:acetyl-CoA carboxylase carboxyl transferase subunit alpha
MADSILDIEKPLEKLEAKIAELKKLNAEGGIDLSNEILLLEEKAARLKEEIFKNLTPWEKVLLARHARRPTTLDYIQNIFTDFMELHGDRLFSDDAAVVGGFAKLEGTSVMVAGHQKGKETKENLRRNFGMASPEGFRKAARLMKLAEKFHLPFISFIDTPGAYPGIGAEERGQFVAIAENLKLMSRLKVPILVCVIGEGGSGGALGLAVGDRILILEHAVYSVISPEGCASILWRDGKKAPEAAAFLHLTAQDLERLKIVDQVIPEPLGGAHQDPEAMFENVKIALLKNLQEILSSRSTPYFEQNLIEARYQKFRKMGVVMEIVESNYKKH